MDLLEKIDLELLVSSAICMDTRLDQPDSVTTFDARGQDQTAFLSLVYDLSNEENCPS